MRLSEEIRGNAGGLEATWLETFADLVLSSSAAASPLAPGRYESYRSSADATAMCDILPVRMFLQACCHRVAHVRRDAVLSDPGQHLTDSGWQLSPYERRVKPFVIVLS